MDIALFTINEISFPDGNVFHLTAQFNVQRISGATAFYGHWPATIAGRVDNDIASAVSLIMKRIETDCPVVMQYRLPCVAILAYLN